MAAVSAPFSGSVLGHRASLAPAAPRTPAPLAQPSCAGAPHESVRHAPAVAAGAMGLGLRRRMRNRKAPRNAVSSSLQEAKEMSQPDRKAALDRSTRERKILGADKTVEDVIPAKLLESDLGKELKVGIETMVEVMHMLSLGLLLLEDVKDKSTVGLHGFKLQDKYVREASDGTESTMPGLAVTSYVMKQLLEHFPEDPVLSDEDGELLSRDEGFAQEVVNFFKAFQLMPDATTSSLAEWSKHCNSYSEGEPPRRYWVFTPIDSKKCFRDAKQFGCTLCLMQDNEPVLSLMGCPVLSYDHPSRSSPHPSGCPIFYAMKGQGAWTQLVVMKRETGVYMGQYGLKSPSLKLNVSEKIRRGNDGLYDMLGTEQLRISQHSRMREDIFLDSERIAKLLGSEFAKFHFIDNSMKFSWLARGDEDISWSITQGLYDSSSRLRLTEHAAGVLIAEEAGASVADLDGEDIDWSTGPILSNNRGLFATDPNKVPKKAIVKAVKEATEKSQVLYQERCEKRREKAQMLRKIFEEMGKYAETEEEIKGAAVVKKRGLEMLDNEEEMMKLTQESMSRGVPILGEPTLADDDDLGGPIPFSPIKSD
ncbi:unnamed protein product [Durusdinium trenchii]|uniref:Uncharacterized protein n=2 Tax=Durusdinium trenchii TaxID=1381693 RepID=A0ABP0LXJ1_9DINO